MSVIVRSRIAGMMVMDGNINLDEALEFIIVHEPGSHVTHDDLISDYYRVDDAKLNTVAYFSSEVEAYRYRMVLVNLLMNPFKMTNIQGTNE